jgi:hypothetical protein
MSNMIKTILEKKRELVSKTSIEEVADIRNTLTTGNKELAMRMVIIALFERDSACQKLLRTIESLEKEVTRLRKNN